MFFYDDHSFIFALVKNIKTHFNFYLSVLITSPLNSSGTMTQYINGYGALFSKYPLNTIDNFQQHRSPSGSELWSGNRAIRVLYVRLCSRLLPCNGGSGQIDISTV